MQSVNDPSGPDFAGKSGSFIERARRAQIVEAAVEVVAEFGYARASLARIAERAGISKGVVTYHFKGKGEILDRLVTDYYERGWEYMEERIRAEETAVGQVEAWVGAQLDFYIENRTGFLAMSEVVANHRGEDGAHQYAADFDEEIDGLAEILDRGQTEGALRRFDARSVADVILRCLDGVLIAWANDPGIEMSDRKVVLLDFISHAILKEST